MDLSGHLGVRLVVRRGLATCLPAARSTLGFFKPGWAMGNRWRGASIRCRLQDDAALYDEQVLPISPILKEASVKSTAVDV